MIILCILKKIGISIITCILHIFSDASNNSIYSFLNRFKKLTNFKRIICIFLCKQIGFICCALLVLVSSALAQEPISSQKDKKQLPFAISVDGQPVDHSPNTQRSSLDAVDIKVSYDGQDVKSKLNAIITSQRTYNVGEKIEFSSYSNYPAFINRSEIRIYEKNSKNSAKPAAILPIKINQSIFWRMPKNNTDYIYILRVYDHNDRYNETVPSVIDNFKKKSLANNHKLEDNHTAIQNIPLQGGGISVSGSNIPKGFIAQSLGENIKVRRDGTFLLQRILPAGEHNINIALKSATNNNALQFNRSVNIPNNEWFYVGLADIYVGKNTGSAKIEEVRPGEYDKVYSKGRLAFYLKGKIQGKYLLTAAADTTEEDLKDIFKNMNQKDPRRLLRNIDPNEFYPIYGDDSVFKEDAPTQGRFYIRLDKGDSHVMWGTYKTEITGTEFMRSEREVYGANAVYRSPEKMANGEDKTKATLYAAQPDTLSQREEFLATGGSAYFMKRQDITRGSETVTVEVRDEVSGISLGRQTLEYGTDYSFNYMQGVLFLQKPLSSSLNTDSAVRNGALSNKRIYLLVNYEYDPVVTDVDGYLYGGRAQHWINDKMRVGVTGMRESTGPADQKAIGADIQLRHSDTTKLEAEIANSKGPGFGLSRSTDGGLSWNERHDNNNDNNAMAFRLRGQLDLEDIFHGKTKGKLGGYYQNKQAGFSSLNEEIAVDEETWGLNSYIDISDKLGLKLNYDNFENDDGKVKRDGNSTLTHKINDFWTASYGMRYTKLYSPYAISSNKNGYNGSRFDTGARLEHKIDDNKKGYIFGQATLSRSGDIDRNDRAGLGGELKLNDKLALSGEASYGTHGVGGLANIDYTPNEGSSYYLGYKLDPDRSFDLDQDYALYGRDMGTLVAGMKKKLNDETSIYSENNIDLFGQHNSMTQTNGIIYSPTELWTINGSLEMGRVRDETVNQDGYEPEDFNRYAPSLTVGYKNEETGVTMNARGEVRIEDSKHNTRNQNSYLFAGGLGINTSEDWRMIANIDAVISDAHGQEQAYSDTDYIETSLGYAYRPVNNSRLNGLFKYTWLYDMPGNNQYIGGGDDGYYAPAQRSHIVSADFNYDLLSWLTIGAKYGFRYGQSKYRTNNNEDTDFEDKWQSSTAHLGIVRTDLHFIKNWDILLEGRVMRMTEDKTTDFGALASVYRHIGDHVKLGVGYNFGNFSDDLRDQDYDDRGVFLNLIGKM